jgi:hypothetical protein
LFGYGCRQVLYRRGCVAVFCSSLSLHIAAAARALATCFRRGAVAPFVLSDLGVSAIIVPEPLRKDKVVVKVDHPNRSTRGSLEHPVVASFAGARQVVSKNDYGLWPILFLAEVRLRRPPPDARLALFVQRAPNDRRCPS